MGLSEQRQRQRLVGSARAKNDAWLGDTSLPGQRLLASMGWAPGAGLGTERQGMSSNLSMALKLDNKGIGAHRHEREALQAGKADAWTGAGGELGSLFERLNAANAQAEEPKPAKKRKESKEEEATPKRSKPAEDVARPAPSAAAARLAHRAKFRRAKQMVGTDASSLNEILGISSAEASARSSPAAEDKAQTPNARASAESSNESEQSSDDEPSSKRRKGKDKGDKGEKRSKKRSKERSTKASEESSRGEKRAKKRSKEEKRAATKLAKKDRRSKEKDRSAKKQSKEKKRAKKRAKEEKRSKRTEAPSGDHVKDAPAAPKHQPDAFEEAQAITPSTQFVFEYLSRKLLLRKAEIHRRKREREADVWRRAQTVGRM